MKPQHVLDACALIAFFNDENGSDVVENLLVRAENNEIDLVIHIINVLEIFYGVLRDDGEKIAREVIDRISELTITVIHEISEQVFFEAGRLKAQYRISLADAIAVSEANVRKALIVTADHHEFDYLEKQNEIKPLWIR